MSKVDVAGQRRVKETSRPRRGPAGVQCAHRGKDPNLGCSANIPDHPVGGEGAMRASWGHSVNTFVLTASVSYDHEVVRLISRTKVTRKTHIQMAVILLRITRGGVMEAWVYIWFCYNFP